MKIDFVTNVAPHYREHLWGLLLRQPDFETKFLFGDNPGSSIRSIDFSADAWEPYSQNLSRVRNYYVGKVLFWQRGVIRNAFRTEADISVHLGDMWVISTWLAVLILRLRRRKVIFWGHGLYGNEKSFRRTIRLTFLRLANCNLVYGERARQLLIKAGIREGGVRVIYNSLDYETQVRLRQQAVEEGFYRDLGIFQSPDAPVLFFIGRLTARKKLDQLIQAVRELNCNEIRYNLILIGDGPDKPRLRKLSEGADAYTHFFGPCYEEERLAELIANADLCVAPGEVGLTAIHSLGYGTPVCTHGVMSEQMPEAEALVHNRTGIFFDRSTNGLKASIEEWFTGSYNRERIRNACYEVVDEHYNPSNQCEIFRETFYNLYTSSTSNF